MSLKMLVLIAVFSTTLQAQDAALTPEALYRSAMAKTTQADADFIEAARLLRQAADRGYAPAQRSLGELYLQGNGVARDESEAAKLFKRAADKGDVQAQSKLANLYYSGLGVKKDEKEALKWFKKAAEHGDTGAQVSIGLMLVSKDVKQSLEWFHKAAADGNSLAQFMLGSIYEGRLGVPPKRSEAVGWYTKALQQGYEDARKPLEALRTQGFISSEEAAANLLTPLKKQEAALARAARINDEVIFEVTVGTDGAIKSFKIIRGHPLLTDVALASIKPLRYRPYMVNGQPVQFVTTIALRYEY